MARHRSSIWMVSVALTGCAATTLPPLAPDHPASPLAAESPAAPSTLGHETAPAPEARAAAGYTCPMHPEIHRPEPGRCPRCGMELVPADQARGHHAR